MNLTSNGVRALTVVRVLAILVLVVARCADSRTSESAPKLLTHVPASDPASQPDIASLF